MASLRTRRVLGISSQRALLEMPPAVRVTEAVVGLAAASLRFADRQITGVEQQCFGGSTSPSTSKADSRSLQPIMLSRVGELNLRRNRASTRKVGVGCLEPPGVPERAVPPAIQPRPQDDPARRPRGHARKRGRVHGTASDNRADCRPCFTTAAPPSESDGVGPRGGSSRSRPPLGAAAGPACP